MSPGKSRFLDLKQIFFIFRSVQIHLCSGGAWLVYFSNSGDFFAGVGLVVPRLRGEVFGLLRRRCRLSLLLLFHVYSSDVSLRKRVMRGRVQT